MSAQITRELLAHYLRAIKPPPCRLSHDVAEALDDGMSVPAAIESFLPWPLSEFRLGLCVAAEMAKGLAEQYPADVFTADGTRSDAIAGRQSRHVAMVLYADYLRAAGLTVEQWEAARKT